MADYRVECDDEASRALLRQYLERRRVELERLREALGREDYELIRRIGHNLFGSGSAYELPRISMFGEGLERAAEAGDGTRIAALIADLQTFLETVVIADPG